MSETAPLPGPSYPLVSVVVRSMDRPTLPVALRSVEAQTWPAIEVVVVNARGLGHARLPAQCGRFELRLVESGGPLSRSQAANTGIAAARGQWICFLDDDDWIEPTHIAALAQRLQQDSSLAAAYSGVSCIEIDAQTGETREMIRYNEDFDPGRLVCENYLPIHSVLFAKEAAARTQGFDEAFAIFEDWDFWIQLSLTGRFSHVHAMTAVYRLGSGDSGLYGNEALQQEFAARILSKWLPRLPDSQWAAVWELCRRGLRLQDRLRADVAGLGSELAHVREGLAAEISRLESELQARARAEQERIDGHHRALQRAADEYRQMADRATATERQLHTDYRKLLDEAAQVQAKLHADYQQELDKATKAQTRLHEDYQRELDGAAQRIQDLQAASAHQLQEAIDARTAAEAAMQADFSQRWDEAIATRQRLEAALESTTREYNTAVALLRQEQYTVLRPVARNLKRAARVVWRRMPPPAQAMVRQALGRPPAIGTQAPPPEIPGEGKANDWKVQLAGGAPGAFTVILFPVIDWHFRIQRPQHLARELGRQGHRVLYLSTTFAAGTSPSDTRLIESPAENVHLLQLALDGTPPNIYEGSLSPAQARQLAEALAWLQQAADLGPLVSLVNLPFWRPVVSRLPANTIVYDCMDFHAGFSTNTGTMLGEEEGLLADCDLLLTTSSRLAELMQAKAPGKPHALVRNGTQVDHFATVPDRLAIERDARPVIGYFGAIAEWFDIDLVTSAARARPDWRFVLVGSTYGCDISQAKEVANIEFTGEVPYAELPQWVHAFDVCLIPFILNELTSCTNPVKVYEYLSAGKPVVATRMPELEAIKEEVFLAGGPSDFVQQIEEALATSGDRKAAVARREWASRHSWQSRAQELSVAVANCLPRVSVIVLCYNNLELTKACLDSVERYSHWPDLELIVVDNASSDGTPAFLKQYGKTRPWVKVILNPKNLGFAAGNNAGLKAATGEFLVMLNNDTEVTPGWIHGLRRHFLRDARLGLVGPVTDNIGNEAKVDVGYTDKTDMPAWAAARTVLHAGERINARVVAFFCVAVRRKVYEQVGGLDESFGLGFFEDDDYCNRARQAGWELAIAEDVFVHHHLSASFDKIKSSTRQALFEKNKAIYERKWGPWIPHQYREAKTTE